MISLSTKALKTITERLKKTGASACPKDVGAVYYISDVNDIMQHVREQKTELLKKRAEIRELEVRIEHIAAI